MFSFLFRNKKNIETLRLEVSQLTDRIAKIQSELDDEVFIRENPYKYNIGDLLTIDGTYYIVSGRFVFLKNKSYRLNQKQGNGTKVINEQDIK